MALLLGHILQSFLGFNDSEDYASRCSKSRSSYVNHVRENASIKQKVIFLDWFYTLVLHIRKLTSAPIPKAELNQHAMLIYMASNEEHSDCSHSISFLTPQVSSNLLLGTKDNPRSCNTSSDSEDNLKVVLADPKWTLAAWEEGSIPSASTIKVNWKISNKNLGSLERIHMSANR